MPVDLPKSLLLTLVSTADRATASTEAARRLLELEGRIGARLKVELRPVLEAAVLPEDEDAGYGLLVCQGWRAVAHLPESSAPVLLDLRGDEWPRSMARHAARQVPALVRALESADAIVIGSEAERDALDPWLLLLDSGERREGNEGESAAGTPVWELCDEAFERFLRVPLKKRVTRAGLLSLYGDRAELLAINARLLREKRELSIRCQGTEDRAVEAENALGRQRDALADKREELLEIKEALHVESEEKRRLAGDLEALQRDLADMDRQISEELDRLEGEISRQESVLAQMQHSVREAESQAASLRQVVAQKETEIGLSAEALARKEEELQWALGVIRSFKNRWAFRVYKRAQKWKDRIFRLRPRLWRLMLANFQEVGRSRRFHAERPTRRNAGPPPPEDSAASGEAPGPTPPRPGDAPPDPQSPEGDDLPTLHVAEATSHGERVNRSLKNGVLLAVPPPFQGEHPALFAQHLVLALEERRIAAALLDLNREFYLRADGTSRAAWLRSSTDPNRDPRLPACAAALVEELRSTRASLLAFWTQPSNIDSALWLIQAVRKAGCEAGIVLFGLPGRSPRRARSAFDLGADLLVLDDDPLRQADALSAWRRGQATPDYAVDRATFAISQQPHPTVVFPPPVTVPARLTGRIVPLGDNRHHDPQVLYVHAGIGPPPGIDLAGLCDAPVTFPRAPDQALSDMLLAWDSERYRIMWFCDPALNTDMDALRDLCRRLAEHHCPVSFGCRLLYREELNPEALELLSRAGCAEVRFLVEEHESGLYSGLGRVSEALRERVRKQAKLLGFAVEETPACFAPWAMEAGVHAVIVVSPAWGPEHPGLAAGYLTAAARRAGHSVQTLDLNAAMYHFGTPGWRDLWANNVHNTWKNRRNVLSVFREAELCVERALEALVEAAPMVVGFTINTANTLFAVEFARRLRERLPETFIVFGGPQCLNLKRPADLYEGTTEQQHALPPGVIDAFAIGEGEQTFVELLDDLAQGGRGAVAGVLHRDMDTQRWAEVAPRTNMTSLDELPLPELDFRAYSNPKLPVMMSRGCPFSCAFCSDRVRWDRFRSRSPESVFAEIRRGVEGWGFSEVVFLDSLVNSNTRILGQLCDLILDHDLKFQWAGNAVIRRQMTREYFDKMVRAGCRALAFGTESFSDPVLKLMNKHQDVREITWVLENAKVAGLHVTANIIVGYPGETEQDFEASLSWVREHAGLIDMIGLLSDCQVLRDTPLGDQPERFGIEYRSQGDWNLLDQSNTPSLRVDRMERMRLALAECGVVVDFDNYSMRSLDAKKPASALPLGAASR